MDSSNKRTYDDFITDKPKIIQRFTVAVRPLLREHSIILKGLGKHTYLSVKEIRNLFWDERGNNHTKSMKTIYRYMDLLEGAKLVKIAGHRKPKAGHITEKLYCRTSKIYFIKDENEKESENEEPYWKSEDFQKRIRLLSKLFIQTNSLSENNEIDINNLVEKFVEMQSEYIKQILAQIEANPALVDGFDEFSSLDFKQVITDLTIFEIIYQHPDFIKKIQDFKKF